MGKWSVFMQVLSLILRCCKVFLANALGPHGKISSSHGMQKWRWPPGQSWCLPAPGHTAGVFNLSKWCLFSPYAWIHHINSYTNRYSTMNICTYIYIYTYIHILICFTYIRFCSSFYTSILIWCQPQETNPWQPGIPNHILIWHMTYSNGNERHILIWMSYQYVVMVHIV